MSKYKAEYDDGDVMEFEADNDEDAIAIAKAEAPYDMGSGIGQYGWGERQIKLESVSLIDEDGTEYWKY